MTPFLQNNVETRLCAAVNVAVQNHDAEQLRSIVIIEPPYPPDHQELIQSLHNNYPESDSNTENKLEQLVKNVVTSTAESEDSDGRPVPSWSSMTTFLVNWMTFLRDSDPENLLQVYKRLSDLLGYVS